MNNTIILEYILLIWGISGLIIAFVTWVLMWEFNGMKVKIYWNGLLDLLSLFLMVGLLSFIWVGFKIYWYCNNN